MSYTVVWKPDAEEELAELWLAADDRGAFTTAADEIERLLRLDPLSQGESRADDLRIMFCDPLVVIYHVDEAGRMVAVLRVWTTY